LNKYASKRLNDNTNKQTISKYMLETQLKKLSQG